MADVNEPTREQLDAWLTEHCGTGLPHGEATDRKGALHGLAYVLRQIEGTSSYKVHIGQCNSATSALRWALDFIAAHSLHAAPPAMDREAVGITQREIDALRYLLNWDGTGKRVSSVMKTFTLDGDERSYTKDALESLWTKLSTLSADAIRQGEGL